MKTNVLVITIFAMIGFITFSCKKNSIEPAGITITPSSLMWYVGANDTLKAVISPSNASGGIAWNSSNPAVAHVNQSGVVTGVSTGTAEITATTGNQLTSTCPVTITRWTNFNTSNSGLIDDTVYSIAIDAQGNKWIGTEKGISKYNGIQWTNYNTSGDGLAKSRVIFIAIDSQGNKWVGDDVSGVSKFDGTHWTAYNTSNSGLASDGVLDMAIDAEGNKWFATYGGISKFDGSNWTTYNNDIPNNNDYIFISVGIDHQGNKWFGAMASGKIWKFDGINWTTYSITGIPFPGYTVVSIAPDAQGNMWFGFEYEGSGISKFDGKEWTNYDYYTPGVYFSFGVTSIAFDAQGNKWFASNDILKFDNSNWTIYNRTNSILTYNGVSALVVDAQSNKWMGSYGDGVSVLYAQ